MALQEIYNHPFFDRLQTRTRRRALVMVYVLAIAGFPIVARATGLYWPIFLVLGLVTLLGLALDGAVRGVTELDAARLDERQRRLRSNSFQDAYWVAVLFAFWGGLAVGGAVDESLAYAAGLGCAVGALVISLPAIVMAWTLPTEPRDVEAVR